MARRSVIAVLGLGMTILSIVPDASGLSSAPAGLRHQTPATSFSRLDLTSFLPPAGEVSGWSPKGEPLVYRGEALFTYIDGGADIYNEYGFRQVAVQDYADASQKTVTLEIFEMADAAAAFGMFTFKTSARGSEVALGQGGRLEDYYLNFWTGPVLVTVTGFDESPESVRCVRSLAEAVDRKIQVRGEKPALAAAFPKEWAERGGQKYLRGPLGLRNLHPVFARQSIRFAEGVAGWPADGVLAAVLRGRSAPEVKTAFSDAQKLFSASPPFTAYRSDDSRFSSRDAKGYIIEGRLMDGGLALIISKGPLSDPEPIWKRLRGVALSQGH